VIKTACYNEGPYAELSYAKCHKAECCGAIICWCGFVIWKTELGLNDQIIKNIQLLME